MYKLMRNYILHFDPGLGKSYLVEIPSFSDEIIVEISDEIIVLLYL